MSDDVFSQTGSEDEGINPLNELVGDGKKFASLEDLAKGKLESDKFITQLEGELKTVREQMAELEEQANKKATVSDLVDAVKAANKSEGLEDNQPSVSEDSLQEMVNSILDGRHEKQTRLANYQAANQAVLDKFNGDIDAARTYTAERARQLGINVDRLKALGEESPSAFKQLMDVQPQTGSQGATALPQVHVQQQSNAEVIDGHHTKAYYNRLKQELGPSKYWTDTKIQGDYTRDAMALGDRFNN